MRAVVGALAVTLPLTPFIVYASMSGYPKVFIYVFMAITAVLGVIGIVRGRGVGNAGLFSAFTSMAMLSLSVGYIPYLTHFMLGIINTKSLGLLSIAIGASVLSYFLGNVYEASARMAKKMKELGYAKESFRELDIANAMVISMGLAMLGLSIIIGDLLRLISILSLGPIMALVIFILVYLIAMALARAHRG